MATQCGRSVWWGEGNGDSLGKTKTAKAMSLNREDPTEKTTTPLPGPQAPNINYKVPQGLRLSCFHPSPAVCYQRLAEPQKATDQHLNVWVLITIVSDTESVILVSAFPGGKNGRSSLPLQQSTTRGSDTYQLFHREQRFAPIPRVLRL